MAGSKEASREKTKQPQLKTLLCKLWNFQVLTVHLANTEVNNDKDPITSLQSLKELISLKLCKSSGRPATSALPAASLRLVQCGKDLASIASLVFEHTVHVELRGSLKGGKGGFGSLLRSVKPKAQ